MIILYMLATTEASFNSGLKLAEDTPGRLRHGQDLENFGISNDHFMRRVSCHSFGSFWSIVVVGICYVDL